MSTAPWESTTPELLSRSHGHRMRAVAAHPDFDAPVQLAVTDLSVTFDERRAPRVTANLTAALDSPELRALDPRTGARVEISAGYVRPGGDEDVHLFADLGARTVLPDLGAQLCRITAASDEAMVIDASPAVWSSVGTATHSAGIQALLNEALSPQPEFVATITGGALSINPVPDRWAAIQDTADRINAAIYDDGLRVFHLDPTPTVAASPVLELTVGQGGTILRAIPMIDREAWHNYVTLRYRWRDLAGVDQEIRATALVNSGPYSITGPAGKRIMIDDREVATTQAVANTAAASVLNRQLSRSTTLALTAVSAYWLRPGMTIGVKLGLTESRVLYLVQAVTFRQDGTMDIDTRLPDPTSIYVAPITTTPPSAPRDPDPAPPVAVRKVSTWVANSARTFKQGGAENTAAPPSVIQGYYSGTNGNQQAVILFTASNSTGSEAGVSITSALTGATISKVEVWLHFNHWHSYAGGTARIGYYMGTTLPASYVGAIPRVSSPNWPRNSPGQGRWVNISSNALFSALKAGTCRGITIGPGIGSDRTYYGKADGPVAPDPPLLRITYAK